MVILKWITAVVLFFTVYGCGSNKENTATDVADEVPFPDTISIQVIAEDFTSPIFLTQPTDDSRLFVVDQTGQIYIVKDGGKSKQPFLDLETKLVDLKSEHEERGLLGLAFHPDFKKNGKFYVYYSAPLRASAPKGWDHTTHVAEYKLSSANVDLADTSSERILLQIDQPQLNHNAGTIVFGPDGYLYISVGDGGGAGDKEMGHVSDWYNRNEGGNGQERRNLLGSILRIDVNTGSPYGIPGDNPFTGGDNGLKEVYAYGLRNPYRFSFAPDGSLIAADAGQELFEEINVIVKGGNYGWNVKEGRHCFDASNFKQVLDSCPTVDSYGNQLIDPVIEFKNTISFPDSGLGIVSIGGVVYHGDRVRGLKDKYLFGVWTQHHGKADGAVYAASRSANDWPYQKLWIKNNSNNELGMYLLGFGSDNAGEAYILVTNQNGPTGNTGKLMRLTRLSPEGR